MSYHKPVKIRPLCPLTLKNVVRVGRERGRVGGIVAVINDDRVKFSAGVGGQRPIWNRRSVAGRREDKVAIVTVVGERFVFVNVADQQLFSILICFFRTSIHTSVYTNYTSISEGDELGEQLRRVTFCGGGGGGGGG